MARVFCYFCFLCHSSCGFSASTNFFPLHGESKTKAMAPSSTSSLSALCLEASAIHLKIQAEVLRLEDPRTGLLKTGKRLQPQDCRKVTSGADGSDSDRSDAERSDTYVTKRSHNCIFLQLESIHKTFIVLKIVDKLLVLQIFS